MPSSGDCAAVCVPPSLVPQIWPHVWPLLQSVFKRTDFGTFRDLEDQVFAGHALLWLAWREPRIVAAVVTQIRITENSRVCHICACGGENAGSWLHLVAAIEEYARAKGCNKIRALGRKGWLRKLPEFRPTLVVIEKDLS